MKVTDRDIKIMEARESGKTLKDVGEMFGLSSDRIRTISIITRRKIDKMRRGEFGAQLSERAYNILRHLVETTLTDDWWSMTREKAASSITVDMVADEPNCGPKTSAEIFEYLGLDPGDSDKKRGHIESMIHQLESMGYVVTPPRGTRKD